MEFTLRFSLNAHVKRELDYFTECDRLRQIPRIAGSSRASRFFYMVKKTEGESK